MRQAQLNSESKTGSGVDQLPSRTSPVKPLLLPALLLLGCGWSVLALAGTAVGWCSLWGHQGSIWLLERYLLRPASVVVAAAGIVCCLDLFIRHPRLRTREFVPFDAMPNRMLTVLLTAYNDELSIGKSVSDFLQHPLVKRVIVVDNNSQDDTRRIAQKAGALVVHEAQQGYGRCVYRALSEGLAQRDTDLTLLCEGDGTFAAFDIDKFMAYIPHADIVNGTRIVEQLRDKQTQLSTFMYHGNFAVGKLLEVKHFGKGTFTDVGTTYKLCRNEALGRLLPKLDPSVNLAFNAHFLDVALTHRFSLLECPVTFHKRIGKSKGGNANNLRALRVGIQMIRGIVFFW